MREFIALALFLLHLFVESASARQRCNVTAVAMVSDVKPLQKLTIEDDFVSENDTISDLALSYCTCDVRKCFRKCCPVGSYLDISSKQCVVKPGKDSLLMSGVNHHFYDNLEKTVDIITTYEAFVYGMPCDGVYIEDRKWFFQAVSYDCF